MDSRKSYKVEGMWKKTMNNLQKECINCLRNIEKAESNIEEVIKSLNAKYKETGDKMPQTDLGLALLDQWLEIVKAELKDVEDCKQDADMPVAAMLADGRIDEILEYIEDDSYNYLWWLETAGSKLHRLTTVMQDISDKWNLPVEYQEAAQKSIKEANDNWNHANNYSTYLSDFWNEMQEDEKDEQAIDDYIKQYEGHDYGYWQWGNSCEEDFAYDMTVCMDSLS